MRTIVATFYGVFEFPPARERECLCILSDGRVRTGYYKPDGMIDRNRCFWNSLQDDASSIADNNTTIEYWAYSNSVIVQ